MSEHKYAGPDTMVPGETATDDPFADEEFCEECDEWVETVVDDCPICGKELM